MRIKIRTARHNEQNKLREFYIKAYPEEWKYKVDEYWEWLYIEAPRIKNDNTSLYIAVDEEKHEIVGQSGVFTQQFSFKSKIYNVAWGSDLYVLEEYRGNQIAQKLHTRIRDDFDFYIAVSYAFSTGKMLKRIGGIELNPVNTYVLPLKMSKSESYKAFNRRMKQFTIGKSFKVIYENKIFRTLYANSGFWKLISINLKNKTSSSQRVNLNQSDDSASFYKNLEQLLNFQSNSFDAFPIFDRDQSEWRFFKHPKKQYHFAYINNEDGKISGTAIYRITNHPEGNYAIISGLYADNEENYKKLLIVLIDKLIKYNPTAIFLCKGTSSYSLPLNKLGFIHITTRIPIIIPRDRNNLKLINNIKTWDFNFESQDLDFYPNFRLL